MDIWTNKSILFDVFNVSDFSVAWREYILPRPKHLYMLIFLKTELIKILTFVNMTPLEKNWSMKSEGPRLTSEVWKESVLHTESEHVC